MKKTVNVEMDCHYSAMGETPIVVVGDKRYMYGLPMPDDHRPGSRFRVTIEKIESPNERPYNNPWAAVASGRASSASTAATTTSPRDTRTRAEISGRGRVSASDERARPSSMQGLRANRRFLRPEGWDWRSSLSASP